ncbi:hypothetical protein DLAC_08405 [Tieghemostelium lacteum]|uniref:Transmembrane protein n=1 Tax=Tieghemostelium lacteum TaxID=361077 RepID=A0A151ZBW1_TIELA|nr:hypothetical protein DLAC_08405 [Tieghemostelium lacteum]|eukprot:KYQ91437.1 hypothetical protein DLAC_08405 [Tieghemostelium lacteum]
MGFEENIPSFSSNNSTHTQIFSKPYKLESVDSGEYSPLIDQQQQQSNILKPGEVHILIGDGIITTVDEETQYSLSFATFWGYLLPAIQFILGLFLYYVTGYGEYFILVSCAFIAHSFSVCLGVYAVSRKNTMLIANYIVYSVLVLSINVAIFIISAIIMEGKYPWWLFLKGLICINLQIFGIKYLITLFVLLRELQMKQMAQVSQPTIKTPAFNHPNNYPGSFSTPIHSTPTNYQYQYPTNYTYPTTYAPPPYKSQK